MKCSFSLIFLILAVSMSLSAFAQSGYEGDTDAYSSYYYNSGVPVSIENNKKDIENNNQDNDFTYNDNRKVDNHEHKHITQNVFKSDGTYRESAIEFCSKSIRNPASDKMRECIKNHRLSEGREVTGSAEGTGHTDFDFELTLDIQCKRCATKEDWDPTCDNLCTKRGKVKKEITSFSEAGKCEHGDQKCNALEKGKLQKKLDKKDYCPECEKKSIELEIAKLNADISKDKNKLDKRKFKIANKTQRIQSRQQARALKHKYKKRNDGFWNAIGTLATAAAGVVAPLLVEKERTKQITSCHNSFSNGGADVIRENRLAYQSQLAAEERNFLPLTPWEQMNTGQNTAFLCNGFPSGGFAGGPRGFSGGGFPGVGGPQFGIGGFNPYGPTGFGGPGFGTSGFNPLGNVVPGVTGGLNNVFNNLQGIIPNINFGVNANANINAGATAWTQQPGQTFGTNPFSPFPNTGVNNNFTFNQGNPVPGGNTQVPFAF